jgi:hypothetical protein
MYIYIYIYSNNQMEGKLINCARCGDLTEEATFLNKKTKNCKACRELHNNRGKTILKCENNPIGGFYKQEQVNILENKIDNYEDLEQEVEDIEKPQVVTNILEKEKTIKELLTEINNKMDKPQGFKTTEAQEELTTILYNILDKLEHPRLDNFIKNQELKNRIIITKLDALINAVT